MQTAKEIAGAETRTRLLDAAIEEMAASEGAAVNFDRIAERIGVTRGAVYHHFGSVHGLVEEVYKESVRCHARLVVEASSEGSGKDRLLGLVTATASLYGSGTQFYRLLLRLQSEAGLSRPRLAPVARRVQERQRKYMAELVAQGQADGSIRTDISAEALGDTVNAALQGFLVGQLESPRRQRRATAAFADLLEALL
ncbi:MAG: TetR/AcrR family transcriptional regulator [Actinobacteria bacterium]|nr:TetR/AcrR family transcriptional regulator [Actinomycetota bacterium]